MRSSLLLIAPFVVACSGGKPPPPSSAGNETPATSAGSETPAAGEELVAGEEPAAGGATSSKGGAGGESAAEPEETRNTQSIQKIVAANRKPIRACYDKARKALPDLKGTLTIKFVLDGEGNVKKAELNIERSDIKAPDLVNCAIAELKKLKFPPSAKGMDTTVNYPFDFKPDGGG